MIDTTALERVIDGPRIGAALAQHGLPEDYREQLRRIAVPLVRQVAGVRRDQTPVLGINGSQGSGKSTLAEFLAILFEDGPGLSAVVLSIDDFYLPREARRELADRMHPLLATRGVPGTHDVPLATATFEALIGGRNDVALPRFDKGIDDQVPRSQWHRTAKAVDVVLFEGWCIGCPPQEPAALVAPANSLEREEDPDGSWRRFVNDQLAGPYERWFAMLDALLMLKVPSFDCVSRWRMEQEQKLIARRRSQGLDMGATMDAAAISRFIAHYERLTRHMLGTLPARADLLVDVDSSHRMGSLTGTFPGSVNRTLPPRS